ALAAPRHLFLPTGTADTSSGLLVSRRRQCPFFCCFCSCCCCRCSCSGVGLGALLLSGFRYSCCRRRGRRRGFRSASLSAPTPSPRPLGPFQGWRGRIRPSTTTAAAGPIVVDRAGLPSGRGIGAVDSRAGYPPGSRSLLIVQGEPRVLGRGRRRGQRRRRTPPLRFRPPRRSRGGVTIAAAVPRLKAYESSRRALLQ
ncbi:unnamed protein product, partial [Ectocarpus sp. 12 AP-2014]